MKATANIATYKPRIDSGSLDKTVASLVDQFDEVRVLLNPESVARNFKLRDHEKVILINTLENLTDNGKFSSLDRLTEPEYYFCCDDDIIYPSDYVQRTIDAIKKFGCIITHHGRKLAGDGLNYYSQHQTYHCFGAVNDDLQIDVCGTGVTAFDTRYFHPKGLAVHPQQRMSDLIFSLEAAKQGKIIGIIKHEAGWLKYVDNKETIYETERAKGNVAQNRIADEIFRIINANG